MIIFVTEDLNKKFGSWRGYQTFGLPNGIEKKIKEDYSNNIRLKVLLDKHSESILDKLYKPGGLMYKKGEREIIGMNNNSLI